MLLVVIFLSNEEIVFFIVVWIFLIFLLLGSFVNFLFKYKMYLESENFLRCYFYLVLVFLWFILCVRVDGIVCFKYEGCYFVVVLVKEFGVF